jgi:hypothetical protein
MTFLTAGFAQRGSPIRTATPSSWSSKRVRAGDPNDDACPIGSTTSWKQFVDGQLVADRKQKVTA